jgi:hypothetical protein
MSAAEGVPSHAQGLRQLLLHLRGHPVLTARLLARAACVCRAWRAEAGAGEHHAVLRFDGDADSAACSYALVQLVTRHANVIEALHVPFPLASRLEEALPPDTRFPRLQLVAEACGAASVSHHAPAPPAATLARAPALTVWHRTPGGAAVDTNHVPHALAAGLMAAVRAEVTQQRRFVFQRNALLAMEDALRPLLTPRRNPVLGAFMSTRAPPPGLGALQVILHRVLTSSRLEGVAYLQQRVAALGAVPSAAGFFFPGVTVHSYVLGDDGALLAAPARVTLLRLAATSVRPSLTACAVLLRAGADPLASAANEPGGSAADVSALAAAAADAVELCAFARHIRFPGACDVASGNLVIGEALQRLPVFWLLVHVAAARHGRAAVDAALAAVGPDALALAWEVPCHHFGVLSMLLTLLLSLPKVAWAKMRGGVLSTAPYTSHTPSMAQHALPQLARGGTPGLALHAAQAYVRHGDARGAWRRHAAPALLQELIIFVLPQLCLAAAALWLAWSATAVTWRVAAALLRALLAALSWPLRALAAIVR